ncbi:MAG TPA: DUF1254 domain-containing protein [Bdellovibrio sp.]|uniref:DUF1254 domain-containing protein n=1 Tax=Bdellovibrio sp. TaxID=28201 RepID=UPI002F1AF6E6
MKASFECTLMSIAVAALISCSTSKSNAPVGMASADEAAQIANEAYIYGYPLVLMGVTRDVSTSTPYVTKSKAPINQFSHSRVYPDFNAKAVVSPNVDTLYSQAWLDLSSEPVVMRVTESDRFYMIPVLDAWTNVVASPGSRTEGNGPKEYVIVGPQWKGTLPSSMQKITVPTNNAWIIGRFHARGSKDLVHVHSLQDGLELIPLNLVDDAYMPPQNVSVKENIDAKTPPVSQVERMDAATFFANFSDELKMNPPLAEDAFMVQKLRRIGLIPGQSFHYETLPPEVKKGIEEGYAAGMKRLAKGDGDLFDNHNGWMIPRVIGKYGQSYMARAQVARVGLGANLRDDAIYPMATTDSSGQQLNGKNKYTIHFAKNETPPVNGFWSLTLYDENHFFVKNPLNRYSLGDRSRLFKNPDGSVDILIQNMAPLGPRMANWLPAPEGDFNLIMRLYWPKSEALNGTWQPPKIQKIQQGPETKLSKNVEF